MIVSPGQSGGNDGGPSTMAATARRIAYDVTDPRRLFPLGGTRMTTFPLRTGRLAAGLSLALLSGCMVAMPGGPAVTGSGVAKTETRTVTDFTEVEVGNAIHLDLTVGASPGVEVTADDNLLPHVITEVTAGRLKVSTDASTTTKIGITVKATTPTLKAVEGSGASTATVTGVQADRFRLGLS